MKELQEFITERIEGVNRLAVLGAGSFLKADDAAGVMITEKLKERVNERSHPSIRIYTGESAPENYTGEIKKFRPDHLLVIDAADMHEEPGSIVSVEASIIAGVTFSTHMLPIKVMLDYIRKETGCEMTILGIQPECVDYGGKVTRKVNESVEYMVSVLENIFNKFDVSSI